MTDGQSDAIESQDEPDPWAEHHDRCVQQFTEAVDWLGVDWVADNWEPMTRLLDAARLLHKCLLSGPQSISQDEIDEIQAAIEACE